MVFSGTTWVVCPGEYVEREIVLETFVPELERFEAEVQGKRG